MPDIEVDKVLGFCGGLEISCPDLRACRLPCVTKLPKFLPTTQCHVAPLRESNCDASAGGSMTRVAGATNFSLDELGDILEQSTPGNKSRGKRGQPSQCGVCP